MRVTGSRLVVRALEDEGVRFVLGIPGTHNIELYDELERSSIRPILVTDEQAGSFMADGFSRTSDEVGVLNLVPGAGVTNAMSGIAEAWMDCVPMVVIAAGIRTDTGRAYQLHHIDQLAMLAPVTKAAWRAETAAEIYPRIREAFHLARRGRPGPVAVEIPANLLMLTHEVDEPSWSPPPWEPPAPEPAAVARCVELLGAAERPVLYLGLGAAGAADLLPLLAERLGAPVCTTIQGKGVFPESHPLWVWNGMGATVPKGLRKVVEGCDGLLAIGCRFGEVATGSYGFEVPRNLIHVDIDPEVFHRNYPAAVAVHADARAFVEALLAALPSRQEPPGLREAIAAGHGRVRESWLKDTRERSVSPHAFFSALQRHAGPDTVYATDSGNGTFLAMEHLRLERPARFIGPVDFSCMGYCAPAAIGAKLANPDRDVVALAGDGALLMTGLELLTAASYRVAPLVTVLRDGRLGQIAQFQKVPLNRETCSVLPDYSLEDLARAVGCRYFRVIRDAELDSVLPEALALTRTGTPAVVEVMIDYSRRTWFTRGVIRTVFLRYSWYDRLRMVLRAVGRRIF